MNTLAKVGLDDFLQAHGVEAFLNLDVQEIPSPYPYIKVWSGIELKRTVIERPPAIVKGWGIRQQGSVILTGMGGKGKSTLLLQVACNLAAGTPLLGHAALEVAGEHRVAVYMAEDPLSEVKFRWEQQMSVLQYGNDVAERIAFLDPQGARLSLTDEHGRQALFAALCRHHTTVAILDPLVAIHDADENSNSAMRRVLDLLAPFQEETGCTFLIAHHEPKNAETNSAASRGASAIRDWCRTMLRLTSHGKDNDNTAKHTLALDKANYGGTVWSLSLERKQDSYIFTVSEEGTLTPMQVWEVVGLGEPWYSDVLKELTERYSVSETTAGRAIKKAIEHGVAVEGKRENPETGREKKTLRRGHGKTAEEGFTSS